jgi:S-DNA-T family DNA segregation ATPase FtsK/SpoIIIE
MKNKDNKKAKVSRKKTDKKTDKIKRETESNQMRNQILSIILLMMAVFLYISIGKYQNMPEETEFIGILGKYIMKSLELLFGQGAVIIPFYLLSWSIHTGISKKLWSVRMRGITIFALGVLLIISIYDIPGGINSWEAGTKGMGGGYFGGGLAYLLLALLGQIGVIILLVLSFVVAAVMLVNKAFLLIIKSFLNKTRAAAIKLYDSMFYEELDTKVAEKDNDDELIIIDHINQETFLDKNEKTEEETIAQEDINTEAIGLSKKQHELGMPLSSKDSDYEYKKPPVDLLTTIDSERIIDKKNIKESIAIVEDTFSSFGIRVKVSQVSCGPAVTRYELTPGPGVKVSRIISLTDDLQLNLAAPGIRIEAPIPGKSAVGIEVPNQKVVSVGIRTLLSSVAFKKLNSPLAFALGEDIGGNIVVGRLNDMPHLLIAGATGSGKSVCINSIIMMLLYNARPEELKMLFIDPKMVELTVYNGIPHLLTPVVTDPKKASVVLRWMVTEMEKRYRLFADNGVRDIQRYNQLGVDQLPFIVIIVDELADLMMVAPVEVEDSICRLAQMARAAGMHLIVATQRPSVDVVTGVIKANIPSRIAFAVSSQADSRTILDTGGAEKLLGKGDMLFLPVGANKPFRVQGAYVSDLDIENTVNYIREQFSGQDACPQIEELEISLEQADLDFGDELFWDAVKVFVENKKASVSLLQRRLRIGYARAARLVDLMEDKGIVSELDNNKKREILVDNEYLERVLSETKLC